ncbi:hypothetical protein B484DRAFT_413897 [Ochromonadaceae sp. CCMP2298]|nr:hypothetical protein B484DRAFT_413897 [Ochromonadaceae sp. CCMP2298]
MVNSVVERADASAVEEEVDAVVVGSGPAGIATAIMLAQQGVRKIRLFDQLGEPARSDDLSVWGNFDSSRSYNIGLSGRGQTVLKELGALERVQRVSAQMETALTWTPESAIDKPSSRPLTRPTYPSICLERDRLTACLLEQAREAFPDRISVAFDAQCTAVSWNDFGTNSETVTVQIKGSGTALTLRTPLVVGADGTNSAVRAAMQQQNPSGVRVKKWEDNNVRLYRTIPLHAPSSVAAAESDSELAGDSEEAQRQRAALDAAVPYWGRGLTLSARTAKELNLEALPTKEGVYLGVVLFRPNDTRLEALKTAADSRAFFGEHFPMFSPFLKEKDLGAFATRNDSRFQRFQFAGPELHVGSTAVLVGDAIHTVKPYFGLGVNSALEDVLVLREAMKSDAKVQKPTSEGEAAPTPFSVSPNALRTYSNLRAGEAKALVELSQHFDRGLLQFLLPLLLDRFLHKLLPAVFSPPMLTSMQDERNKFAPVRRRKHVERLLQGALLASLFAVAVRGLQGALRLGLRMLAFRAAPLA